jgi:hypothetical protein
LLAKCLRIVQQRAVRQYLPDFFSTSWAARRYPIQSRAQYLRPVLASAAGGQGEGVASSNPGR